MHIASSMLNCSTCPISQKRRDSSQGWYVSSSRDTLPTSNRRPRQRLCRGLRFDVGNVSRLLLTYHPWLLSRLFCEIGHVEQFSIELAMCIRGFHDDKDGTHDHQRQPNEGVDEPTHRQQRRVGNNDIDFAGDKREQEKYRRGEPDHARIVHELTPALEHEDLVANFVPPIERVISGSKITDGLPITADCSIIALLQKAHEYPGREDDRCGRSDRLQNVR